MKRIWEKMARITKMMTNIIVMLMYDDGKNSNKETMVRFLILNKKKNSMFLILQLIIYRQQALSVKSQKIIITLKVQQKQK